jgi:chromosome segregation ATPase
MWKNIKSLFIVEEEGPAKGKQVAKKEAAKPVRTANTTQNIPESKEGEPGKVRAKFMEVLLKAMDANNLKGFDYLEYKQSLNSLKNMPMDEKTRYQSAMAMAKTMGGNPDMLTQTAQHYIDVLKNEEQKFEQALSNQIATQVDSKKQQIKKLEETIASKAAKIKELTQQIETHQKKQEVLGKEIKAASSKVASTKNDFIASYNSLVSQIQEDINNIQQYLK